MLRSRRSLASTIPNFHVVYRRQNISVPSSPFTFLSILCVNTRARARECSASDICNAKEIGNYARVPDYIYLTLFLNSLIL